MRKLIRLNGNKTPADNGRFCEIAAVPPQKRQCVFGSYYPAGTLVKPPPRQAAGTLSEMQRRQCNKKVLSF